MSFNFNDLKISNSIKREAAILTLLSFPSDLINSEIEAINYKIQSKINANSTNPNLNTIIDDYVDKIQEQLIIKKNIYSQEKINAISPVVPVNPVISVDPVIPVDPVILVDPVIQVIPINPNIPDTQAPVDLFRNRRINRIVSSQIVPTDLQPKVIKTNDQILQNYRKNVLLRKR
jgi:hypothetical protein